MLKIVNPPWRPKPPDRPVYEALDALADPKLSQRDYQKIRRWELAWGFWEAEDNYSLPAGTLVVFDSGFYPIHLEKPGAFWEPCREPVWAAEEDDVLFYRDNGEESEPGMVMLAIGGMIEIGLLAYWEAEDALAEAARRHKAGRLQGFAMLLDWNGLSNLERGFLEVMRDSDPSKRDEKHQASLDNIVRRYRTEKRREQNVNYSKAARFAYPKKEGGLRR